MLVGLVDVVIDKVVLTKLHLVAKTFSFKHPSLSFNSV